MDPPHLSAGAPFIEQSGGRGGSERIFSSVSASDDNVLVGCSEAELYSRHDSPFALCASAGEGVVKAALRRMPEGCLRGGLFGQLLACQ